jgi:hypothetical protein
VRRRIREEEAVSTGRKACVVAIVGRRVLLMVEVQVCGEVVATVLEG